MKKISRLTALLPILGLFMFAGCNPSGQMESTSDQNDDRIWPDLLMRNEGIDQTAEWESTVHRVNTLSSDLVTNPNDPVALVELATLYTKEARVTGEHGYYYPAILDMLEVALSQDNIPDESLHKGAALRANVLLAQHRFVEGLEAAKIAHELNPYNAQVFAALIDAHVELGQYGKAVELGDQLMQIKPGLPAYARASYLREIHGDLPGAIEAMQYAVTAGYPGLDNTEWARITLGSLYEKAGEWDRAEQAYAESLVHRPEYPFAKAGLARVAEHRGEYANAEQLLRESLRAIPEIGFQVQLHTLYQAWGKSEHLESTWGEIVAMVEDDKAHGHNVDLDYAILIHNYGNDPNKALQLALNEYKSRPDNIDVNATLAGIYASLEDVERAQKHYAAATRTGKDLPPLEKLARNIQ